MSNLSICFRSLGLTLRFPTSFKPFCQNMEKQPLEPTSNYWHWPNPSWKCLMSRLGLRNDQKLTSKNVCIEQGVGIFCVITYVILKIFHIDPDCECFFWPLHLRYNWSKCICHPITFDFVKQLLFILIWTDVFNMTSCLYLCSKGFMICKKLFYY